MKMTKLLGLLSTLLIWSSAWAAIDIKLTGVSRDGGYVMEIQDGELQAEAIARPETFNHGETNFIVRYEANMQLIQYTQSTETYELLELNEVDGVATITVVKEITASEASVESIGGRFATGLRGQLEKVRKRGSREQEVRLIFRHGNGQFVTWVQLDVQRGWNTAEVNGKTTWRFEERYNSGQATGGRLVTSISLTDELKEDPKSWIVYDWAACPALSLRYGENVYGDKSKGALATLVYGLYYQDEDTCRYYVDIPADWKEGREGGSGQIAQINNVKEWFKNR
jgi:hypothetical protein